jgi:hypothetical protein
MDSEELREYLPFALAISVHCLSFSDCWLVNLKFIFNL